MTAALSAKRTLFAGSRALYSTDDPQIIAENLSHSGPLVFLVRMSAICSELIEFPPGTCLITITQCETASRTLADLMLIWRVRRTPSLCAEKMALLLSTLIYHGSQMSRNPSSAAKERKNSTSVVHDASAMHSLSVDESDTARCILE